MDLVFIRYIPKNTNVLLVELGAKNGKICGLLTNKTPDNERTKIVTAKNLLDGLNLTKKLAWIKKYCPVAYKLAYREIKSNNAIILSKYKMHK